MASKMTPLYNSIALWGPSRGSPWETPEGLGPCTEVTCRVRGRAEVVHKCLVGDRSGRCGRRRGVCPIWRRRGVGKEGFPPKEVI